MSERWERELRKLDAIDAPPTVRRRIDDGPTVTRSDLPGTRQRVVAAAVAFAVFAVAGAFAWRAFAPTDDRTLGSDDALAAVPAAQPLVIEITTGDASAFSPSATLMFGDATSGTCTSATHVEFPDGTGQASDALCGPGRGVTVPVGTPIEVVADDGVSVSFDPRDPTAAAGDVTLTIEAEWPPTDLWLEAGASFVAALDVQASEPSGSPDVSIAEPSESEEPRPEKHEEPDKPEEGGVPNVLRFRCDPNGIELLTPVVATQADGLHVDAEIAGVRDAEIGLASARLPGASWWSGSSGAEGEFVRAVPTGKVVFVCEPGPEQGSGVGGGALDGVLTTDPAAFESSFKLVDPEGHFGDYILTCPEQREGEGSILPGGEGGWPTIEDAMRANIDGLLETDVVEQAGYPRAEETGLLEASVARDGELIGTAYLEFASGWGYAVMWIAICSQRGISLAERPTG